MTAETASVALSSIALSARGVLTRFTARVTSCHGESQLSIVVECWRCGISYAGRLDAAHPPGCAFCEVITEIEHG